METQLFFVDANVCDVVTSNACVAISYESQVMWTFQNSCNLLTTWIEVFVQQRSWQRFRRWQRPTNVGVNRGHHSLETSRICKTKWDARPVEEIGNLETSFFSCFFIQLASLVSMLIRSCNWIVLWAVKVIRLSFGKYSLFLGADSFTTASLVCSEWHQIPRHDTTTCRAGSSLGFLVEVRQKLSNLNFLHRRSGKDLLSNSIVFNNIKLTFYRFGTFVNFNQLGMSIMSNFINSRDSQHSVLE